MNSAGVSLSPSGSTGAFTEIFGMVPFVGGHASESYRSLWVSVENVLLSMFDIIRSWCSQVDRRWCERVVVWRFGSSGSVLMLSRTKKYSNSSCLKVVFNVLQVVVVGILSWGRVLLDT